MNATEYVMTRMDLDLAKKSFLYIAAVSLVLIPINGLGIYLEKNKTAQRQTAIQEISPKKLEPEESYLANFDRSALFGSASAGIDGVPALQASLSELTKDYRLQGVILTDEPEAILQDAKTQKTVFIKKGGLLGELTVKEIKEGMIVLGYLGEEIKLEIQS